MTKRILALCLAVFMVVGLIPAAAADTSTPAQKVINADLSYELSVDGSLSEAWDLTGKLSDGEQTRAFGALWDTQKLCLAYVPEEGDGDLTVTLNGETFTAESSAVTAATSAAAEFAIPLSAANITFSAYNEIKSLTVSLGSLTWSGSVRFGSGAASEAIEATRFGAVANAGPAGRTISREDGAVRFQSNSGVTGRSYQIATNLTQMTNHTGTGVVAFDIDTAAVPEFYQEAPETTSDTRVADGLSFGILYNVPAGEGLTLTLSNVAGELVLFTVDTTNAVHVIELGKQPGDSFRLRADYSFDDKSVDVFVDDALVGHVENLLANRGWGTTAANMLNFNLWADAMPGAFDVSLSNFKVGNMKYGTPLNDITFETIKGSNSVASMISSDLELPESVTDPILGEVAFVWSSSDETVINAAGVVTSDKTAEKSVTLTVALAADPTVTKSFELTVPGGSVDAFIPTEAVTLDGSLDELSWMMPKCFGDDKVYALWDQGELYLGLTYADAASATITLGSKTWTDVALGASISADGITGAAANGAAELRIDLAAAGISMKDYGEQYSFNLSLKNASGAETKLSDTPILLNLTGTQANLRSFNDKNYVDGATIVSDTELSFSPTITKRQYWGQANRSDIIRHGQTDIYLEQTLDIENLVGDGTPASSVDYLLMKGYSFWIAHGVTAGSTTGGITAATVWNDNGELKINVRKNASTLWETIDLGVRDGSGPFTLGYKWTKDNIVTVYVNDVAVGTVADSYYLAQYSGYNAMMFNKIDGTGKVDVSNMSLTTTQYNTVADEITKQALFQAEELEGISESINLPTTFTSAHLGELPLRWESSNTNIIANDGTVTLPENETTVQLSVFVGDSQTALWSINAKVSASRKVIDAILSPETITVDGKTNELAWTRWNEFSGAASGTLAAAWNKGMVYFAVNSEADTLTLTIGETTATVDLAAGTVTGVDGAQAAKQGSVVEISLPTAALGITLADYNDEADFTATLSSTAGTASLAAPSLRFTGKIAQAENLGGYSKSAGYTLSSTNATYSNSQDNAVHYAYKINLGFSTTETTYFSKDLRFTNLPVTSGDPINNLQADGYYFYASRNCTESGGSTRGDIFFVVIYNDGGSTLKANICKETSILTTCDLGVAVGEQFHLSLAWGIDGSVKLYVNGALKASAAKATYTAGGPGNNVLTFRFYSKPTTSPQTVKYTVDNFTILKNVYNSVEDELMNAAEVLGRADLDHVRDNLPMNSSYSSKFFESIPVRWESSNTAVVANDGTVTRGAEAGHATITLYVGDHALWSVDVTVDPANVVEQPSSPIVTTSFSGDTITIDGSLTGETWLMGTKILANGQLKGELGAQWDKQNLYVAIQNNGADYTLTVNNVAIDPATVTTATSGNYTELRIPMSTLGLTIEGYDVLVPISATVGDGSFSGQLKLSSVDWWATGNREDPLPVVSNYAGRAVATGSGKPNGNQGAVEVSNGWHFYDLYEEGAENPASVRVYTCFMRTSPYENFADRSGTVFYEFDVQPLCLPVYDPADVDDTGSAAYANFGINWSMGDKADSSKNSNVFTGGVFNSEEGLYLVTSGAKTYKVKLNKQLGDLFRVGYAWNTDGSVDVFVDGTLLAHYDNQQYWCNSIGDTSFVINTLRNKDAAASAADNIDVYISNIAFGRAYSSNPLDRLTFDDIKGENEAQDNIQSDLVLPQSLRNEQLDETYNATWTSTEPDVIDPTTGAVTRPEAGAVQVTLTITLESGESKSFDVIVIGIDTSAGATLVVLGDKNPAVGVATANASTLFTFDAGNNSVVVDLGESKSVNVVRLTDLDTTSHLSSDLLTIWASDDNEAYTNVGSFKLLHVGRYWYLYDFEAQGRYIKVHYTMFEDSDSDFIAPLNGLISAYHEDVFGGHDGTFTSTSYTLTNNTGKKQQDYAWHIAKADLGVTGDDASIRVYLGNELLYHFVDGSDVVVRVPDIEDGASVTLTVKSGAEGAMDIANKEGVYEVTYGTREAFILTNEGRWLFTLPAGHILPNGQTTTEELLLGWGPSKIRASRDGGLTWFEYGSVSAAAQAAANGTGDSGCGGFFFDEVTGRIFYEEHNYKGFNGPDMTKSDCVNVVLYSDDGGKTWELADVLEPDTVGDKTFKYMLSYSDGLMVSSYDGEGPNVDFVFPTGCQYNNNGAFCVRVAYSTDGGMTWQYSPCVLTYGNETAFEGGCSEAYILENDAHRLVLYCRCQSSGVDNFAKYYSDDFGITWNEKGITSTIYTVNTQPIMYRYDNAPLFIWGGNNVLGGNSYIRDPLNVAISYDGLETWRNIQNLFARTSMEIYTSAASHYITNPSVRKIGQDDFVITFSRLRHGNSIWMKINNFSDYFYRTKGAYDSFEHGTIHADGWVNVIGEATVTSARATEGTKAMLAPAGVIATRSIPYLQNGTISLDIWAGSGVNAAIELQPAFATTAEKCCVAKLQINGTTLTCGGATLTLNEGWNKIDLELTLTEGTATIAANGGAAQAVTVSDKGDYVCYVTLFPQSDLYIDAFLVESDLDAERYTHDIVDEPTDENWYEDISEYRGETFTAPTREGKVFAGWYQDAEFTTPIEETTTEGGAYAKFVDEAVLSVKWQITAGTNAQSTSTKLRLLTSVDTLNFTKIGFTVDFGGVKTLNIAAKEVYRQVTGYVDGNNEYYAPSVFSPESEYFATAVISGIKTANFDTTFTITPTWTTKDGTVVNGIVNSFKVSDDPGFTQ